MRWAILAAVALAGLSGCNVVVSEEPWFTEADSEGVPTFRDGLWLRAATDCDVDVAAPPEQWPECADATRIRGREWLGMRWTDPEDGQRTFVGWETIPMLIAKGDPMVIQLSANALGPPVAVEADADVIDLDDVDEFTGGYLYAAMRPTKLDQNGEVVAYETWPVLCGPEPAARGAGTDEDPFVGPYVTRHPFPGLTVVGDQCVADSSDALRAAAILSDPLAQHNETRWVGVWP